MSPGGHAAAGTLAFRPLTADDEDIAAQWLSLLEAAVGDQPDSPPPCPVDLVGSLRFAPPSTMLDDWVACRGDRVVGSVRLALHAAAEEARVDSLVVHPEFRRRGIGRALHAHAAERTAQLGRKALSLTVTEALPDGPPRDPAPVAFAAAIGATRSAQRAGLYQVLDLTRHDPLTEGVPDPAPGYRLTTWGTVTPGEFALAVSALEESLGTARLDTLSRGVEESYARQFETMRVGRGRRAYHTGVIHQPSGQLIGYTSISMTASNPHHALQGMTVIHVGHRGRGLGRLIKLANLRHARLSEPMLRLLETTNDEANDMMIAINVAMGFRPRDRRVCWQSSCTT